MRQSSFSLYRTLSLAAAAAAALLVACAPEGELLESATVELAGERIGSSAPLRQVETAVAPSA